MGSAWNEYIQALHANGFIEPIIPKRKNLINRKEDTCRFDGDEYI